MKKTITLDMQDIYLFLVSAVRYSLGRRSYIVGWVCEQVRAIAPRLKDFQRKVIIESIQRCEDYGDKYSKLEWLKLLDWLENHSYSRKKGAKR